MTFFKRLGTSGLDANSKSRDCDSDSAAHRGTRPSDAPDLARSSAMMLTSRTHCKHKKPRIKNHGDKRANPYIKTLVLSQLCGHAHKLSAGFVGIHAKYVKAAVFVKPWDCWFCYFPNGCVHRIRYIFVATAPANIVTDAAEIEYRSGAFTKNTETRR